MSKIRELYAKLSDHLIVSPASISADTFDTIDAIYNQEFDLTDATSPFVNLLECSATHAAAAQAAAGLLTRRQYPKLAETMEDLYYHMSDADHLDRFVKPVTDVTLWVALPAEGVRANAILDPAIGLKKITLPADSQFSVDGYDFLLHWPVDVIVTNSNQLTARYDLSYPTPLRMRQSNVIESRSGFVNQREYFFVAVSVDQLSIFSEQKPISIATGGTITTGFQDQFHYVRVFSAPDGIQWQELHTTHVDHMFDPQVPTAVVRVVDGAVTVTVPEIYLSNGTVKGTLRIDVTTSKGAIAVNFSDYANGQYNVRWNDFGNLTTTWSAPIAKLDSYYIYGTDRYIGGGNGLTFDQMKQKVVYNLYSKPAAMTADELRARLESKQYRVSKQKDNIFERVFVASNDLPKPAKDDLSSAIGIINTPITIDASRTDIASSIVNNGQLVVVKPESLYVGDSGGYRILSDMEKEALDNLSLRNKADALTEVDYFYNPFHYVLDNSEPSFNARAYHLPSCRELARSYIANNNTLGFIVSTLSTSMRFINADNQYQIVIDTQVPGNNEDIIAVLNYRDAATGLQWDMIGDRVKVDSTTYRYTFTVNSQLDIDKQHNMTLSGFTGPQNDLIRANLLNTTFDLVYVIPGAGSSSFDSYLARQALTQPVTAVVHERLILRWGKYLDKLNIRTRVIAAEPVYARYTTDEPAYWPTDVIEQGPSGNVLIPDGQGGITYNFLHRAGDPVMEDDGVTQKYHHRAGDIIYDPITDLPKIETSAYLQFDIRMALLDAAFLFSDTQDIIDYRDTIPDFVITTLESDILSTNDELGEELDLFYEPIASRAAARVSITDGRVAVYRTALRWSISVALMESAYNNAGIRNNIAKAIRRVLSNLSENKEISLLEVYKQMNAIKTSDIRSITVESPFTNSDVALLLDDNAKWSIASQVVPLSNGRLDVVDAIDLEWTR